MLIATTNDVAGYDVQEVLGEVFGLTVRSRNIGSQIGASFKSLVGGELGGMTKMLAEGREEAIPAARRRGGDEKGERDPGDALRHIRARVDLDRDLRLRDRRADQEGLGPFGAEPRCGRRVKSRGSCERRRRARAPARDRR